MQRGGNAPTARFVPHSLHHCKTVTCANGHLRLRYIRQC